MPELSGNLPGKGWLRFWVETLALVIRSRHRRTQWIELPRITCYGRAAIDKKTPLFYLGKLATAGARHGSHGSAS